MRNTGERLKVVAVVQARMGSTRLPGKALLPLNDNPVLWHVMTRVKHARLVDEVYLATTNATEDLPLVMLAREYAWNYVAVDGPVEDVMKRFIVVYENTGADVLVRITADCPLVSPTLIDFIVAAYIERQYSGATVEYVSNVHPPTYPDGLDVEVFSPEALAREYQWSTKSEREHVTGRLCHGPYSTSVAFDEDDLSGYRLTLDYMTDYLALKRIFRSLGSRVNWPDAIEFIKESPSVAQLFEGRVRNEGQ